MRNTVARSLLWYIQISGRAYSGEIVLRIRLIFGIFPGASLLSGRRRTESVIYHMRSRTMESQGRQPYLTLWTAWQFSRNIQASQRADAERFIYDFLKNGKKPTAELDEAAKAAGISRNTLGRAKTELRKRGLLGSRAEGYRNNKAYYSYLIE